MTGTQIIVICTVIATLVTVLAFVRGVLRAAREREVQDKKDRAELAGESFARGVASREAVEQRLVDQRDDARHDRDAAEKRVEQLEARVQQLQDQQRPRPERP